MSRPACHPGLSSRLITIILTPKSIQAMRMSIRACPLSMSTEHIHWACQLSMPTERVHWVCPLNVPTEHVHWACPLSMCYGMIFTFTRYLDEHVSWVCLLVCSSTTHFQPWMIQYISKCDPLLGVYYHHLFYQIHRCRKYIHQINIPTHTILIKSTFSFLTNTIFIQSTLLAESSTISPHASNQHSNNVHKSM